MKFTNKFDLPGTILRAVQNDPYSRGKADKSVTQLINSPRIDILRRKHFHEMETDISEMIWSLFGRAVHTMLERAGEEGSIVEERLYARVRGWTISGAIDVQREGDLANIVDYKVTSTYSYTSNPDGKKEWIEQQNIYAWLVELNKGIKINNLYICAIFRDWKAYEARRDKNYPESPILMIELPLWTYEEREKFVIDRVRIHQEAEMLYEMGEEPPHCTDHDRWVKGHTWAVHKQDDGVAVGRAKRVFDSEAEAIAFIGDNKELTLVKREGKATRCEGTGDGNGYCGIARWCSQYQSHRSGDLVDSICGTS